MEFWSTIGGLLRRPVVIIPAVLVALALGALAWFGTPATYMSSATMVITTTEYGGSESQDPTKPDELTNPMLNFNASLQTTSAILIQTMGTNDVLKQLGANQGTTQLVVNDGRTNPDLLGLNGPFLYIEGRSTSAAEALRVVQDAQKLMKQKLAEWQRDLKAPQKTYVSIVDVVSPTAPQPQSGRAMKLSVMAFLFGFVLCLGLAYLVNQVRARRRTRRAAAVDLGRVPPPTATPERSRRRSSAPSLSPDGDGEVEPAAASPKPAVLTRMTEQAGTVADQTPATDAQTTVATLEKHARANLARVPLKVNGRARNR